MFFQPFLNLAAVSPGRQKALRVLIAAHLAGMVFALAGMNHLSPRDGPALLGNLLLVAGIVEGALLLGWRLSQLPKSQALEFLLVSPLHPPQVLVAEALVGLVRLALVTLAGLPVLVLLVANGQLFAFDLIPLLGMPFTWGAVTGLALVVWAYEVTWVRRWGERFMVGSVILYLLVGVLAAEHLRTWLTWLPDLPARMLWSGFRGLHELSPFTVMKEIMQEDPGTSWPRLLGLELAVLGLNVLLLLRAAFRLKGHFQDRHYRPALDVRKQKRSAVGDHPLSWWAVKRVTEYSGRINLWLAGGFAVLYAAYTLAGPAWPNWLGRQVFLVFDRAGGIPVLATVLILLAAVPAAFQYGLWDSNAQDRCRRLELLLLTGLQTTDYWRAAAAAAWTRGRGYFFVAGLLWLAGLLSGQLLAAQVLVALASGVILWGLYFTLGFRAFSRGLQANTLGMVLTIGLPLMVFLLYRADWPILAGLLPPGTVYQPANGNPRTWAAGPVLGGGLALILARISLNKGDRELRCWYDQHHGRQGIE